MIETVVYAAAFESNTLVPLVAVLPTDSASVDAVLASAKYAIEVNTAVVSAKLIVNPPTVVMVVGKYTSNTYVPGTTDQENPVIVAGVTFDVYVMPPAKTAKSWLIAPLIVLLVRVCTPAKLTSVSVAFGIVTVAEPALAARTLPFTLRALLPAVSIVLFVKICDPAIVANVSAPLGIVTVPPLEMEVITGAVNVLFVNVCVAEVPTSVEAPVATGGLNVTVFAVVTPLASNASFFVVSV